MFVALWLAACHSAGTGDPAPTPTGGGGDDDDSAAPYHPAGWAEPDAHGLTAKLEAGHDELGADCRACHGEDLGGALGPACADCHGGPAWVTDCTFCHGDPADGTGAPPRDIDGETDPASLSFPAHRSHTSEGRWHTDYDCHFCHDKPEDALAPGHLFDDDTAGRAELAIPHGGDYDQGSHTCASYCHGDGTGSNGDIAVDAGPVTCDSCHPSEPFTGHHEKHRSEGIACETCHPDVASGGDDITERKDHADGTATVALPSGITFDASDATCTGTCHFELHANRDW